MATNTPLLFNALSGKELMEKVLRDIRAAFENDTRFRQHVTYPNVKYTFSFSMKYEPGMAEQVNVAGHATLRDKLQAQADQIARMIELDRERAEKVQEIEAQAGLLLAELEKAQRDLSDANDFIKKLHADKLALEEQVKNGASPNVPEIFNVEQELKGGGTIEVSHESPVIEEPDRLRDAGETVAPIEEIELSGGGEAQGEPVSPVVSVAGRQSTDGTVLSGQIPAARAAEVAHGRPPAGVKGRPRS